MRGWVLGVLWWSATWLWSLATAVEPLAGPWVSLHADGSAVVSLEMPLPVDQRAHEVRFGPVGAADGEAPVFMPAERVERSLGRLSHIHRIRLPAGATGRYRVSWAADAGVEVLVPERPGSEDPVTVAVVAPASYPVAADLEALAAELGARPSLVVLLGPGAVRHIGYGGWEAEIPLVVVQSREHLDEHLAVVCGEGAAWPTGLSWGALGLPAASGADRAASARRLGLALARDLSRWQVPLEPQASWRLDRVPEGEDPVDEDLREILLVSRRRAVPLVLANGPTAAFLSDPLGVDVDNRITGLPGGTRYCSLQGAAGDLGGLPRSVARFLPEAPVAGLRADQDLRLALVAGGVASLPTLRWDPWPEPAAPDLTVADPQRLERRLAAWYEAGAEAVRAGRAVSRMRLPELRRMGEGGRMARDLQAILAEDSAIGFQLEAWLDRRYPWPWVGVAAPRAWGIGDPEALGQRWRETTARPERAELASLLSWLPADELMAARRSGVLFEGVLARYRAGEPVEILLHRLAMLETDTVIDWSLADVELPEAVVRDALLAHLHAGQDLDDPAFARAVAELGSPMVTRALLVRAEQRPEPAVLYILRALWRRIAEGRAPLPEDPVVQHRLASAVFDSPYLSPTPLRPLAVALRERLHPGAVGPIERFLAEHGSERPLER